MSSSLARMAAVLNRVQMDKLYRISSDVIVLGRGTPRVVAAPDFHDKTSLSRVYVIQVNISEPGFQSEQCRLSCITKPYKQHVTALSNSNLGLKTAGPNNLTDDMPSMAAGVAHLAVLDTSATGQPKFTSYEISDQDVGHAKACLFSLTDIRTALKSASTHCLHSYDTENPREALGSAQPYIPVPIHSRPPILGARPA